MHLLSMNFIFLWAILYLKNLLLKDHFQQRAFFLLRFLTSSNFRLPRSSRFLGNMLLDMAGISRRTPLCFETGPSIQVRDKSRHQWTLSPITSQHGFPNTCRYCCKLWGHMTELQYFSHLLETKWYLIHRWAWCTVVFQVCLKHGDKKWKSMIITTI